LAVQRQLNNTLVKALSLHLSSEDQNPTYGVKSLQQPNRRKEFPDSQPDDNKLRLDSNDQVHGGGALQNHWQEKHIVGPACRTAPASAGSITPPHCSTSTIHAAAPDADVCLLPAADKVDSRMDGSYFLQSDGGVAFECFQEKYQPPLPPQPFDSIAEEQLPSASCRWQQNASVSLLKLAPSPKILMEQENGHEEQAGVANLSGRGGLSGNGSSKLWVDKGGSRKLKEGNGAYEAAERRLKVSANMI
jgi:hypothetical protein